MDVFVVFPWPALEGIKREKGFKAETLGGGPSVGYGLARITGEPRGALSAARKLGKDGVVFTETPAMIGERKAVAIGDLTGYVTDRRTKKVDLLKKLAAHLQELDEELRGQDSIDMTDVPPTRPRGRKREKKEPTSAEQG